MFFFQNGSEIISKNDSSFNITLNSDHSSKLKLAVLATKFTIFPVSFLMAVVCNSVIIWTVVITGVDRALKLRLILVAVLDVVQAFGLTG